MEIRELDKDPFTEYLKENEPERAYKTYIWKTAIGLQQVDGLKPSEYLIRTAERNIIGDISISEAEQEIVSYYRSKENHAGSGTEEADLVSCRISEILSERSFSFNPAQYQSIHRRLFEGIYRSAGQYRTFNITKKEWVLDGDTVTYGGYNELKETLEYDIRTEKEFSYAGLSKEETVRHLARFVSNLWQNHVFSEGNTRTTAVFLIKYLRTMGFDVTNDLFASHSWYFRNALVRANYANAQKGIWETTEYLEYFLGNLLFKENHILKNRYLHVNYSKKQDIGEEKQDIDPKKQDIDPKKQDIGVPKEAGLSRKTISHAEKLLRVIGKEQIFSRKDVTELTGLSPSSASAFLKKMLDLHLIIPAAGHGKGKYRFR